MTTATAPKRKKGNVLAELDKLEAAVRKAADAETSLSRQLFAKRTRLEGGIDRPGLYDARRKLLARDPAQFNPDGSPCVRESDAGEIQADRRHRRP